MMRSTSGAAMRAPRALWRWRLLIADLGGEGWRRERLEKKLRRGAGCLGDPGVGFPFMRGDDT